MKVPSCSTIIVIALCLMGASSQDSCNPQGRARSAALDKAESRQAYVPHNDLEFKNYDRRQRLTDDPTQIIWCTAYFTNPNAMPVTFPILGKLTSGTKRPFPDDPGPDGMYGSSGEYRYGFTPSGNYVDFYNIQTICTNQLMVWQKQTSKIAIEDKTQP